MDLLLLGALLLNFAGVTSVAIFWQRQKNLKNKIETLNELNDRLIERNEQLEPGARMLDKEGAVLLQSRRNGARS